MDHLIVALLILILMFVVIEWSPLDGRAKWLLMVGVLVAVVVWVLPRWI